MARYEKKAKEKDPTAERADALGGGSSVRFGSPNIPKKHSKRYLSWTFVGYPDSLPENWLEQLSDLCVPFAVSPLHDKDKTELGEPKKPHYHVLLSFRSVKSFEQIKEITDKLNAPIPQPCNETRGLVRYFLHLDNPNKAQYSRDDIVAGCGFDLENALQATATEEEEILDAICDFLEENWITEFADANSYIRHYKKEWRLVFRKNSFYLSQVIKSQRHMGNNEKKCTSPTMSKEQMKAMQELLKSCSSSAGGGAGWTERSEGNLRNRQDEDDYLEEEEDLPF